MREITVLAPAASVHHSKFSKSQFTSHHWSRQTVKHFPNVIHLLPHTSTQLYVALHILQSNSRVRKEKKHSPRLMSFFVLWHNKTYFTRELNDKTHGNWKFFCHLLPNYPPVRCWRHLWTALGWFGTLRRTGPLTFTTFFLCRHAGKSCHQQDVRMQKVEKVVENLSQKLDPDLSGSPT